MTKQVKGSTILYYKLNLLTKDYTKTIYIYNIPLNNIR